MLFISFAAKEIWPHNNFSLAQTWQSDQDRFHLASQISQEFSLFHGPNMPNQPSPPPPRKLANRQQASFRRKFVLSIRFIFKLNKKMCSPQSMIVSKICKKHNFDHLPQPRNFCACYQVQYSFCA